MQVEQKQEPGDILGRKDGILVRECPTSQPSLVAKSTTGIEDTIAGAPVV